MRSIDELEPDPRNPRKIGSHAADGLRASMHEFGDLGGIVWNRRTGYLVSGHQRVAALKQAGATGWEPPATDKGDGAIVDPRTGERFMVRVVDWDHVTQRLANLTANNPEIAGEYTADAGEQLRALEVEGRFAEIGLRDLLATLDVDAATETSVGDADTSPQIGALEYRVIVSCADESDQATLLARLEGEGRKCQPLIS